MIKNLQLGLFVFTLFGFAMSDPPEWNLPIGENINEHIANYGVGNEKRLTGLHETQRIDQFSYGVSDRGASVRIPWQVEVDQKGYLEDRRPASNMDPYLVTKLLLQTTCG